MHNTENMYISFRIGILILGKVKHFLLINNKLKYFMNLHSYFHVSAFLQATYFRQIPNVTIGEIPSVTEV